MSVSAFNSLSKGEYPNLFIVAIFSSKSFSCKTSLPVKILSLLTFLHNKAEISAVILSI